MSAEKIIDKIMSQAQEKTSEITENARLHAAEILEGFDKQINKLKAEQSLIAEQEATEEARRVLAAAALERRLKTSSAKQEVIDKAFEMALSNLSSKNGKDIAAIAEKHAGGLLSQEGAQLVVSSQYEKLCGEISQQLAADGYNIPVNADEKVSGAGFIIRRGKIEDSFLFSAMIREQYDELLPLVAAELF